MKHPISSYVILAASIFAGSTHAEKTLWGDIDSPDSSKSVTVQGYLPQQQVQGTKATTGTQPTNAVQAANAAAAATVVTQRTTCDILSTQVTLDPNVMRSTAIQDALRNNSMFLPQQYKVMVASTESLNALYAMYRTQYLKTYCSR